MYYEIIYENGEVSVANYDSDEDAVSAITEQHNRAKAGGQNGPQGGPASRIVRAFVYPNHPGDYGTEGGMSADEVKSSITALLKGVDVVDVQQLSTAVSALNHPMITPESPHDSRFKQDAERELADSWESGSK
jgi:hypothetical protein